MGNLAAEQATPATLNPTVRTREYLTQREIDRQHAGSIRESFRFGATGRGRKRRIQYGDCALARSALGQKQTYAVHKAMSALPPKATSPIAGITSNSILCTPRCSPANPKAYLASELSMRLRNGASCS
jgi:hypothetical protein